ncbi:N-acyl-D-amino-acid deacylase family protein [Flavihumibacter sp. UBA7668]|uniref:N-acyl-D-amino-acid deacylase family protein n=1 Tax=Flavihumibacter sp. UBA7668 TaxID=1946542 RepID=UPI0025C009DE|nr:D-aminoacylase [Flavihumibacter sp. UBA7668]
MHNRKFCPLFLTLLITCCCNPQLYAQDYDILLINGKIINGTGNAWFYGDLAIKNGKIAAIGQLHSKTAKKTIDVKQQVIAPGFIDVHGHIEGSIFRRPTADNFIYDGVTTVITGNCGSASDDLQDFFRKVDSTRTSINIASLAGHNTIRRQAVGLENIPITNTHQRKMDSLMSKAMQDGAVGLSTGLIYLPGMYAKTEEVVGMAKVTAAHGGIYASHIRSEGGKVAEAIDEAIEIGRQAKLPVQISHFKVAGRANWGRSKETLDYIKKARVEGYDVTIDQYPYTASSTNLNTQLPDWAQSGGLDSIRKRLGDAAIKARIEKEMLESLKKNKYPDYSHAVVARHEADSSYNGKSIPEINLIKGRKKKIKEEIKTVLDLIQAGGAQMVYHSMSEDDIRYLMAFPHNMVGADAGVSDGTGMPHPRGYGSNARVLGKYVREEKIISLEEAIRRMTSLAAQKFNLPSRGILLEGRAADIVVFDPSIVSDKASFSNPHQFSVGFEYILVNGKLVLENGKHTGLRTGQVLRKGD